MCYHCYVFATFFTYSSSCPYVSTCKNCLFFTNNNLSLFSHPFLSLNLYPTMLTCCSWDNITRNWEQVKTLGKTKSQLKLYVFLLSHSFWITSIFFHTNDCAFGNNEKRMERFIRCVNGQHIFYWTTMSVKLRHTCVFIFWVCKSLSLVSNLLAKVLESYLPSAALSLYLCGLMVEVFFNE